MNHLKLWKKGLLLAALSLLVATGAYAQEPVEKGAWLFSGGSNFGYNSVSQSGGGSSVSTVNMNLKGGYFFMDNLAGGLLFDYYSISGGGSSVSSTGIGLFARYYVSGKFFLGAGFQSQSSGSGSSSTTQIPIEAGYAFFFNKTVAMEPALVYRSYSGGSTFGLNLGFTVFLGRGE